MRLSAPIFTLKRNAKRVARSEGIALHVALDRVAITEGYKSWSHLASALSTARPADRILQQLSPGDLILLGARPGQGKTLLGLELAARAVEFGRTGFFFTLDYHHKDIEARLADLELDPQDKSAFVVDTSNDISADHITARVTRHTSQALVVVDYLQLLDQKRSHPPLEQQVHRLATFAKSSGTICVLISQVDRAFDLSGKAMPTLTDIRMPNPLDLSCFDGTCFLHDGHIQISRAA